MTNEKYEAIIAAYNQVLAAMRESGEYRENHINAVAACFMPSWNEDWDLNEMVEKMRKLAEVVKTI